MHKPHLRRRHVVALATAFACLIALGNPAAAVPVTYSVGLTAGGISLSKTGITPEEFNLAPDPTDPSCSGPSIDLNFTSNTTSSQVSITRFDLLHLVDFDTGTFLVEITRSNVGNTPGHLDSTTATHTISTSTTAPNSMRLGLVIRIYQPHTPPTDPCTISTTPLCTLGAVIQFSNATTTSVSTGTTFSATVTSVGNVVANPTCSAGPSYLVGTTLSTTVALTGTLT